MPFTIPRISVPVLGEDAYPVRRIWCVGANYSEHAREMGLDPNRQPPFFFAKPYDAIVQNGAVVPYPPMTKDYHYELELVLAVGAAGVDVPIERAGEIVYGYAVGLDMTRRDLQAAAREKRTPWDLSKGFDQSAPIAAITPMPGVLLDKGRIELTVNGEVKQSSDLGNMTWGVAEIISILSQYVALHPGDLIFTGTPAGIGPVVRGDRLQGKIDGLTDLSVSIG
jgi:fumarylpyruvate hydrolase